MWITWDFKTRYRESIDIDRRIFLYQLHPRGQRLCDKISERRRKYFERGYAVRGDQPPKNFSPRRPPWKWGPKGISQRRCMIARRTKIRQNIEFPWELLVEVASKLDKNIDYDPLH
jgi:hypothetical protein